jgi:hypothetical protein
MQQTENYLLVPRVMDRAVGVNPTVTLLAIAGFGALLGLPGAVLAIPLAAIVQLLVDRYLLSPEAMEPEHPERRDAVSILRYHVQELVQDIRLQVRHKTDATTSTNDRLEEAIEAIAQDLDLSLAQEAAGGEGQPQPNGSAKGDLP